MKELDGKVAVVTGTAMGMGKCIAGMLLSEGCKVALLDVDEALLSETREALSELGACQAFTCDVSDRGAGGRQIRHRLCSTANQRIGSDRTRRKHYRRRRHPPRRVPA